MPYVSVKITREPRATPEQKAEVIREVTDVLARVLDKDPETTVVVIEEIDADAWGIAGEPVSVRRAKAAQRGPG